MYHKNFWTVEKIGRRIRMTHTREGAPDFEEWMTKMRALAGP